jgi:PqqD family protein of HPr-rel-A system
VTYRLAPSVLHADLDAEEVLLNPATGQYHLLNRTGREIVDALGQGAATTEVAEAIARRTNTPIDQVQRDVESFVAALVSRGLVDEMP